MRPPPLSLISTAALLFATAVTSARSAPTTMKQYALIFRQNRQTLSEGELKLRAEKMQVWLQRASAEERKLDPHMFEPEGVLIRPGRKHEAVPVTQDGPLTAVLLIEAKDLEDAIQVAESHPGVEFGASVEVRPWLLPTPIKTTE